MRIFVLSYRKCYGTVGGSGGVNYKLYLANMHNNRPVDMIHVFQDVVIEPSDTIYISSVNMQKKIFDKKLKRFLKRIFGSMGLLLIMNNKRKVNNAKNWILAIAERYSLTNDDIFICHDVESACALLSVANFDKTMLVYHQQGSLYDEWSSFTGQTSRYYQQYLDKIFVEAIEHIKIIAFPSLGARASLLASSKSVNALLGNRHFEVLYNGFDKPNDIESDSNIVNEAISWLNSSSSLRFTTVASLNHAKGVERIPKVLSAFKGRDFRWVLVGDGVEAQLIENNIAKYGLERNIFWIKEPISHASVCALFSNSQFYILLHRRSIFDFATIEAMSFGNIPILTKIGGNIEVIEDDSGFLLDDLDNVEPLLNYIEAIDINEKQEINRSIVKNRFSESAFLSGYLRIINDINDDEIMRLVDKNDR